MAGRRTRRRFTAEFEAHAAGRLCSRAASGAPSSSGCWSGRKRMTTPADAAASGDRTEGDGMRKATTARVGGLVVGLGLGIAALAGTPAEAAETVRLCTGSPDKTYVKVGQNLAELAPQLTAGALRIEVVPTGGSLATMLNLKRLDPDTYGGIGIHPANGFEGAMAVINGEAQCLLDVIAPRSDLLRTLNDNERTSSQLYFAQIDNDGLEEHEVDGKKVYTLVEFDDETYPNLATTGDPGMLAMSAVLAVPRDYARDHPQAVAALSMLLLTGARDVEREAYGETRPFEE